MSAGKPLLVVPTPIYQRKMAVNQVKGQFQNRLLGGKLDHGLNADVQNSLAATPSIQLTGNLLMGGLRISWSLRVMAATPTFSISQHGMAKTPLYLPLRMEPGCGTSSRLHPHSLNFLGSWQNENCRTFLNFGTSIRVSSSVLSFPSPTQR